MCSEHSCSPPLSVACMACVPGFQVHDAKWLPVSAAVPAAALFACLPACLQPWRRQWRRRCSGSRRWAACRWVSEEAPGWQASVSPGGMCVGICFFFCCCCSRPQRHMQCMHTAAEVPCCPSRLLQVADFDFAPFAETAVLLYGAAFVAERYAGACLAALPDSCCLSCLLTAVLLHMGWLALPATRRFASFCPPHQMCP